MNLTTLVKELDKVEQKHHQVDCKFMTPKTLSKKYATSSMMNNSHNTMNGKLKKHRYYKDIKQDEIEDQNIFGNFFLFINSLGFSFFQYMFKSKHKHVPMAKLSLQPNLSKLQHKNSLQIKHHSVNPTEHSLPVRKERPKTSLIPQRGIPTKRRIHHKLSLNQHQMVASSQNLTSITQSKQQFFTQAFFHFNFQDKENQKKNNFLKTATNSNLNNQQVNHCSFKNQVPKNSTKKLQRSSIKIKGERNSSIYNLKSNYEKCNRIPNLKKQQQHCLDFCKIEQQKVKFNKDIEIMFQTLTKKQPLSAEKKLMLSKSIIYPKKVNKLLQKNNQDVSQIQRISNGQNNGFYNFQDYEQLLNSYYCDDVSEEIESEGQQQQLQYEEDVIAGRKQVIFQTQLTQRIRRQTQKLFSKLKINFDIQTISLTNGFFLQSHQLSELLSFESHARMTSGFIEENIIKQIVNLMAEVKQFKNKSIKDFGQKQKIKQKSKPKLYNLFIFVGSTLEVIKLEGLKIIQGGFLYEGKLIGLLQLCENLLLQRQVFDFVHVLVTSYPEKKKNQGSSSPQEIQQKLVFETFIHNSDINYFQGREVQIQFFKYFLKRFMTFDVKMRNRRQIEESVGMILQSEVEIPLEFEQFCKDINLKGNLNIFTFRSELQKPHEPLYRCFSINLSNLLIDAHKSIQMIKKELLQGYNWKGVSLKIDFQKNIMLQLEHFHI